MKTVSSCVLAIDPGKDKCGFALVRRDGFDREGIDRGSFDRETADLNRVLDCVIEQRVVARNAILESVRATIQNFPDLQIVIGDATTSRVLLTELRSEFPQSEIAVIDESGSTLEARALYWHSHPPRGWRRLLPLSAQFPPRAIDDFAAVVIAARFLASSTRS